MKKMILLAGMALAFTCCSAQHYEASYECVFSTAVNGEGKPVAPGEGVPVTSTFIYTVKADAHYLHVKGRLKEEDPSGSGGPISIRAQTTQSEVIIDLEKGIAFLPDEEEYQLVDRYHFTNPCNGKNTDSVKQVSGQEASVAITLARNLPWYVSPGVVFRAADACSGIRKVVTKSFTIELTGTPKKINGSLDYSHLFSSFDRNQSYERYRFFD